MNETSAPIILLPQRGVIRLTGADRVTFLQGLVSNDVRRATMTQAVYAALLTPQGKFLHDMFIIAAEDCVLLDVEAAQVAAIVARLNKYKLRSAVTVEDFRNSLGVAASIGAALPTIAASCISFPDPRISALGWRLIMPCSALPAANMAAWQAYDQQRIRLGIADSVRDLIAGESILLEANFDHHHGVDFAKGCYVGQELTARTHYRGLIKKRLGTVQAQHALCPPQGTLLYADGVEVGIMRSSCGVWGLALLKTERIAKPEPIIGAGISLLPVPISAVPCAREAPFTV